MPGNVRAIVVEAERRFPIRIALKVPPSGIGTRYTRISRQLLPRWNSGKLAHDELEVALDRDRGTPYHRVERLQRLLFAEPGEPLDQEFKVGLDRPEIESSGLRRGISGW